VSVVMYSLQLVGFKWVQYTRTNLEAPTRKLQNIKGKHVDQPAKKRATTYHIHVLPLLNYHGWKQLIFKNI